MSTPGRISLRQSIRKAVSRRFLRSLPWLLALASVVAATNPVRVSPTSPDYRVYATNERAGTVTVLEPREARAVATIPIGGRPRGIAASPDGRFVYVAVAAKGDAGNAIACIDTASGRVVRHLASGTDPEQVAVAPDGGTLWVSNEDAAKASAIDVRSGKVTAAIPVGEEPEGVAISPDGR